MTESETPAAGKTKGRRIVIILILGMMSTITPFAIDMYLPSFLQIAKDLDTTSARLALTISSYFVGLALGQLLYGPFLDRFGRKKPLYVGLAIYVVACVGIMVSPTVEMMIALRFVQAVGGCVAGVAAITMVRDFFPVNETAKIISMLVLILGVSPLIAPTFGGFIATTLGWQWIFIILILFAVLVTFLVIFFLPNGRPPERSVSLRLGPIFGTYLAILRRPRFYTYALAGSLSFSTLLLYVGGSPIIFMGTYHLSPQLYGGVFALLSIGFIGSNQLNVLLLRKFRSEQLIPFAMIIQVAASAVFLIGAWKGWYGIPGTIILFFICLSCLGLTYPNASAIALRPFARSAGSASALIGFLQIGVSAIVSSGLGLFNAATSVPISAIMTITSLLAFVILLGGTWRRRAA